MENKSICKSCKSNGEPFKGQHGTKWSWNVEFENGDKGLIRTNTDQSPFQIGVECEYIIEEKTSERTGNKYFAISKPQNKNFKRKDPTIALKAYACKYATRFVTGEIIPAPKDGDNQAWMKFVDGVTKSAKSFYKEMMHDVSVYGSDSSDVIGTAMSQAIDCVLEGKIQKDRIYLYYRILLEAVLQKQQLQQ